MTSAWGSTETAPMATSAHFQLDRAGNIGVPVPGTEIKLVPNGGKLELLVRGANVTPGYFRRPDLTKDAFDEEGFYRIGDAGRFEDMGDPARGIVFDGRVAEDFKLLTGTWVSTGALRIAAIAACSPLVQDVVVTGHDRDEIGLLVFPNMTALAAHSGQAADTSTALLVRDPAVIETIRAGLARHNEANPAGTTRIGRALIMCEPPLIDANEITDKGYINQRAVLERRAALVERLHSGEPCPDIVVA
jgi:feruloyl-CoA synthase